MFIEWARRFRQRGCEPGQRAGCANASDFVRNAPKAGLRLEADYGVNSFKFGIIASPDDHQSLPGAADDEEFATKPVKFGTSGGFGMADRGAGGPAWFGDQPDGGNVNNPGGLIGVWAEANTRDTIFDALRRRETFGDSGPRIHVRFFAGWDYPADLDTRRDMLEEPYRTGVPMGSDLPDPPGGNAGDGPRFVVWAMKDPNSANLQKIQIVKVGPRPASPRPRSPRRARRLPSRCTTSSAPTGWSPTRGRTAAPTTARR